MRAVGRKKERKQARNNKERNTLRKTKERESEEDNGRKKCRETRDIANPAQSFLCSWTRQRWFLAYRGRRYYCVHRILNYVLHPSSSSATITHSVYSYFCICSVLHIRLPLLVVATFLVLLKQRHTLSPRWRHDKSLRRHSDNNSVHCCTARTGHEEDKEQH